MSALRWRGVKLRGRDFNGEERCGKWAAGEPRLLRARGARCLFVAAPPGGERNPQRCWIAVSGCAGRRGAAEGASPNLRGGVRLQLLLPAGAVILPCGHGERLVRAFSGAIPRPAAQYLSAWQRGLLQPCTWGTVGGRLLPGAERDSSQQWEMPLCQSQLQLWAAVLCPGLRVGWHQAPALPLPCSGLSLGLGRG